MFKKSHVIEALEYEISYKIAGSVINSLLVLAVGYFTVMSSSSISYKTAIVFILLLGLIAEIYITVAFEDMVPDYAAYLIITINFLVRSYAILQNVQEPLGIVSFDASSSQEGIVSPIVKQLEKAVGPVAAVEKVQDNEADAFINKFRQLGRQARTKVGEENFNKKEYEKALSEIVKPAAAAGKYSDDIIREAAKSLKDMAGNVVEVVFGGGRRRKR